MKKFFYACAAILCLMFAYHFGATKALGQSSLNPRYVGTYSGHPIVASGSQLWILEAAGSMASWGRPSAWGIPDNPPVPADEVENYSYPYLVTTTGVGYVYANGVWSAGVPVPGGPTPTIRQSFGQLKARYR